MTKYRITLKRDMGGPWLINGKTVTRGFVVILETGPYKGCNPMPGATWFQTEAQAMRGIECLEASYNGLFHDGGIPAIDSDKFWKLIRA